MCLIRYARRGCFLINGRRRRGRRFSTKEKTSAALSVALLGRENAIRKEREREREGGFAFLMYYSVAVERRRRRRRLSAASVVSAIVRI